MDSATLRQEVSSTESDLRASQRDLSFTESQANNETDSSKKDALQSKVAQLQSDVAGHSADHTSAIQDLRAAESAERKEELAKEAEKQKTEQAAIEKEANAKKSDDSDSTPAEKDKKSTVAKKEPVLIGGELYNITDAHEDPQVIQDRLLAEVKKYATPKEEDTHASDSKKDKSEAVVSTSTAAKSTVNSSAIDTLDSGRSEGDTPVIKSAAASSGPST